jgi:hypothetical protein
LGPIDFIGEIAAVPFDQGEFPTQGGGRGGGGGGEEQVGASVFRLNDDELTGTERGLEGEDVGTKGGGAVVCLGVGVGEGIGEDR